MYEKSGYFDADHLAALSLGSGNAGKSGPGVVDFLKMAGQTCWQVLPIGPTGYGDSPYQPFSSFAGNPYLIDLDELCEEGLLEPEEYQKFPGEENPASVDYGLLYRQRYPILERAVERLERQYPKELDEFCDKEEEWLDDYALFMR